MTTVLETLGQDYLPKLIDPDLLVFVRHGQTDWNAEGRMQGHRDIPLNSVGEGQALSNGRRIGEFLAEQNIASHSLDFVASPLSRTRQTMELVRQTLGMGTDGYRTDDRLKEITFGDWEGFTLEDLADSEQDLILKRRADKWNFVPPGGESYAMLAVRVADWLKTVDRPSVVVSHGGVYRVVRGLLEGLEKAYAPKLNAPQDRAFIWQNSRFQELDF